jgi:hypothetical protein
VTVSVLVKRPLVVSAAEWTVVRGQPNVGKTPGGADSDDDGPGERRQVVGWFAPMGGDFAPETVRTGER